LFLPVLLALPYLYPWAADAANGPARWAGELAAAPARFKSIWLMPSFFALRSVAYLVIWSALAVVPSLACVFLCCADHLRYYR
jgi:hypothetical protein